MCLDDDDTFDKEKQWTEGQKTEIDPLVMAARTRLRKLLLHYVFLPRFTVLKFPALTKD